MSCIFYYLNILASVVVNKYFTDTCVFIATTHAQINLKNQLPVVNLKIDDYFGDVLNQSLHFGCENILVQSSNLENNVKTVENLIKLSVGRFNKRKYLLLADERLSDNKQESLFKFLHFVPDVLLVMPENMSEIIDGLCEINFSLHTNKYVGLDGNDDVIKLDTWFSKNESFLFDGNLYPDKISDMQGRVLKMATFNYKPYAVVGIFSPIIFYEINFCVFQENPMKNLMGRKCELPLPMPGGITVR